MNGAEGLRSTFGFIDTKGKPNELGFCFSIFMEKNNILLRSFAPRMVASTRGCSMDNINLKNKRKNQNTKTRVLLEPGLIRAGPIPKEEEGNIGLLLLKIPGHLMSGFSAVILHSYFQRQNTYPCLAPVFLLREGVSIARTFPEQGG